MEIGILTWHKVNNYGTFWLCYAMQQYIKSLGHEPVLLDYKREMYIESGNEDTSVKKVNDSIIYRLRNMTPNRIKNRRTYAEKLKNFIEFREKYFNIGKLCTEADDCDAVIIGSDQIFDCKYEFNPYQYGIGIPCSNISAYAPSFGEVTPELMANEVHREEIAAALKRFNVLTARDENTREIIAQLIGFKPEIAIDPVLMYGFEEERKVWNDRLVSKPYMVIYTWGGTTVTTEFAKRAKAAAKLNGLKTISVGERRPWCDIDYASASPVEFFKLFLHADMVLTNMFHGTCFSILFNRPFFSISMPHNKNKLEDVLFRFGLESQLVTDISQISSLSVPRIDFDSVNKRVSAARMHSRKLFNQMFSTIRG
jgi:hypothetical protein